MLNEFFLTALLSLSLHYYSLAQLPPKFNVTQCKKRVEEKGMKGLRRNPRGGWRVGGLREP